MFRSLILPSVHILQPGKMVTDHFDAEATDLMKFWIRGESVSIFGLCYCILQLESSLAVKVALATSAAVGVLYPWNAKFGYITSGLPTKYPMHYVPEVLMAVLTVAGALAL